MKSRRLMTISLVALAMLPLAVPAAQASTFTSILGKQVQSLGQQAKGDAQGIGTVDLTHPKEIPGQIVSNAQTAALEAQLQAEEQLVQNEQAAIAVQEAQIAALKTKLGCS